MAYLTRRRKRPAAWNVPEARDVRKGPLTLEEVIERFPVLRQSLLAKWDDCHLSTLFATRYWALSSVPADSGTIFHRFAAEALRTMQAEEKTFIPTGTAWELMEWALDQADVAPQDIVTIPLREMPLLEMAAKKFANDNRFNVGNILDVERRLSADLRYQRNDGTWVTRTLSGQLDALIAKPTDEAIVIDWKRTWGLPPEQHPDSERLGVSVEGYFQQLFYAWLVMKNYSAIQAVSLREFYVLRTKTRSARKTRADMDWIEKKLARLCRHFDAAVAAGAPPRLTLEAVDLHGHFKPMPGKHCFYCKGARYCPLSEDELGLPPSIRTQADAERLAGERQVAKAIVKQTEEPLSAWAHARGPIPLRHGKAGGKWVLGHRQVKDKDGKPGKTRFEEYMSERAINEMDHGDYPRTDETPRLEDAMRRAAARAREGRIDETLEGVL